MKSSLIFGLLIAAVLAVAVVAGLMVRRDRSASRQVTLSTGNTIEVLALLPAEQSFTSEKPWERRLRQVLPARWVGWLAAPTKGRCGSGTNSATLYLRIDGLAPGAPLPWSNYVAEDDTGFRYPMEGGYCSFGGGAGGGGKIFGFTLRAFPRRQKDFLVRFLAANRTELGALRVANPYPGPFPAWAADSLPITRTNGPVALTLASLELAGEPAWRYLKPQWRLAATDARWAEAKAGFASVADATGNEGSILSPREPVWRVRTRVHRQRREDFNADERAVFAGLPVPGAGAVVALERTAEQGGVKLRLRAIADQGTLYFTNGVVGALAPGNAGRGSTSDGQTTVEYWSSDRPFLLLEIQGATWEDETRLRLGDQTGQELKLDANPGYDGLNGGGQMHLRKLAITTNTTALSLEVIVSRPLTFEFFIRPDEVRPAAAR